MSVELIVEDKQKRTIQKKEEIKFSSFSSFHLIQIIARAKNRKQLSDQATNDENITIKINSKTFPELIHPQELTNSPAAFSGTKLRNLSKTIYLLTFLKGKNQIVTLETNKPPNTASFEGLSIHSLSLDQHLDLAIENQAEDGDRRPWITLVLVNLPLVSVTPTTTFSRRKRDSDDVKIIIDGKTQGNLVEKIKHFLWRYVGSLLPWTSPIKTMTETLVVNLPSGLHYIEFWADRMPVLKSLTIDFGIKPSLPEGIPAIDNPKWTGDFYDDTSEIILARAILGEAEGVSEKAKIAVGWTIKNRVLAQRDQEWGLTYHDIILKTNQFDAFVKKERLDKLTNPLNTTNEEVKKAWYESCTIASQIVDGSLPDPTDGATNFYSTPIEITPGWATPQRFKIQIDNVYFYKL